MDEWIRLSPWLLLILAAEFVNGWTDSPNAIATVVATRVLSPLRAVIMAAVMNLLGAMSGPLSPSPSGRASWMPTSSTSTR